MAYHTYAAETSKKLQTQAWAKNKQKPTHKYSAQNIGVESSHITEKWNQKFITATTF